MRELAAGFIGKRMARKPAELRDRRDWPAIQAWARTIAAALAGGNMAAGS
jgi:hypothetical protein